MSKRNLWIVTVALVAVACGLMAVPSLADSQARIVRLSSVEGDVQIDHNASQGYEKAFLNLPITQGAKLRTGADGRAEVEFEDGSTIRLTPKSVVEFRELALRDSGGKLSTVYLQEGTAYLNFTAPKDDQVTLSFGHEKLTLINPAHLRVRMGDTDATLAVFKGEVSVAGPSGTVQVGKKESATFNLADQDHYTVAKNTEEDPYDSWDKQAADYHQRYMASGNSYSSYSPYAYGTSDLNYYGNFMNVAGYGNMWQPYFTGAGWDPFQNGAWGYTPGFGYGWASSYPWGWTPYHTGSWVFVPAYGWLWQPGGSWSGLALPRVVNPPTRFIVPQPPATGHNTVVVGRPVAGTPVANLHTVVIQNGSAGLGVPRGTIKNLGRLDQQVRQAGSATATVHTTVVRPVSPMAMGGNSAPHAGAPHSGSPRMSSPSHTAPAPHSTPHSSMPPHH
jgi:hypothetical protein